MSKYGITRAHLRLGSQGEGGGNGDDHFQDMAGSHHFVIYITPQRKTKGYAELKALAEAQDCHVQRVENDPLLPGKDYLALKITKPAKGSRRKFCARHTDGCISGTSCTASLGHMQGRRDGPNGERMLLPHVLPSTLFGLMALYTLLETVINRADQDNHELCGLQQRPGHLRQRRGRLLRLGVSRQRRELDSEHHRSNKRSRAGSPVTSTLVIFASQSTLKSSADGLRTVRPLWPSVTDRPAPHSFGGRLHGVQS